MSIRDELIEIGCRKVCEQNNEDPDYVARSHWVTLGRPPAPNWKYREYVVAPVVDAIIARLQQRAKNSIMPRHRTER